MNWILTCYLALDEKNGAGMRAVLPYLRLTPPDSLTSLYLHPGHSSLRDTNHVRYLRVPLTASSGIRYQIQIFFRTLQVLKKNFKKLDHFILLPDTIHDVIMGLACLTFSPNITIWMMDDFISTYQTKRGIDWIYRKLFHLLYLMAKQRVVVSSAMSLDFQKRYGVKAHRILGKTLNLIPTRIRKHFPVDRKTLRFVYIGHFSHYYYEPIETLKALLETDRAFQSIELDLFGMHPPPQNWLSTARIQYRGALENSSILKTLSQYDFGILPYSFDVETRKNLSLSFPSKLIDYLGASLPVFTIAPSSLSFLENLHQRHIGLVQTDLSPEAMRESLRTLQSTHTDTYSQWSQNAYQWAQEEFLLKEEDIKEILKINSTKDR